jgi:hypothetical protein
MASYTGQQRFLVRDAEKYVSLGYKVGFAKGKELLSQYVPGPVAIGWWGMPIQQPIETPEGFDGISIIPDGLVCVDIDINDFGVIWDPLPITLKERTPRGWHLFYKLPVPNKCLAKIKWKEHVDLLCKPGAGVVPSLKKKSSRYGGMKEDGSPWGEHVLISGTTGYQRIWPDDVPHFDKLTEAPLWLVDALER